MFDPWLWEDGTPVLWEDGTYMLLEDSTWASRTGPSLSPDLRLLLLLS